MLQNITILLSFTLLEGIEKIKNEELGKKFRRKERGFRMEWVSSILAIRGPFPTPYKHGRSEGFTAG